MKNIYLLRHAKAANAGPHSNDHERPLTDCGRHAARAIGIYMRQNHFVPEKVLSSDARRTRETLDFCQQGMQKELPSEYWPKLYLASPNTMLTYIQRQPDDINTLMLVGHNPGLHQLALELAAHDASDAWDDLSISFPTASLAIISCDVESWGLIGARCGKLLHYACGEHMPETSLSA